MNFQNLFATVVVFCLIASASAYADKFNVPAWKGEQLVYDYKGRIENEATDHQKKEWKRWDSYVGRKTIRRYKAEEGLFISALDEIVLTDGTKIVFESTYRLEERMTLISFRKLFSESTGRDVIKESVLFESPSIDLPDDTYSPPLEFPLQALALNPDGKQEFHFYIDEGQAFKMYAENTGIERVTTPAGSFECYRFKMWPDVQSVMPVSDFFAAIASRFTEEYRFWFSNESPHYFIKSEGPMGPPGAPGIIVEVTEIKSVGGLP